MKTLVKISFVIVCALFVSISVKAADPVTGTLKVNVPEKLTLSLSSQDVTFEQAYGSTAPDQETTVGIDANVKWTLKITTTATNFETTTGETIPVSNVTLAGDFNTGTFGAIADLDGQKDKDGKITWKLANLGNIFAGTYSAPVTFTLVKR